MLDKNSIKVITKFAIKMGLPIGSSILNMEFFATKVGLIENNGKLIGNNPTSSAEGLYQFIDGSIEPAINRVCRTIPREPWMTEVIRHKSMNLLTKDQQTLIFIADILEKRGSEKYTKRVMEGDRAAMVQAYFTLHHTNPGEATKKRAERIIYERKG